MVDSTSGAPAEDEIPREPERTHGEAKRGEADERDMRVRGVLVERVRRPGMEIVDRTATEHGEGMRELLPAEPSMLRTIGRAARFAVASAMLAKCDAEVKAARRCPTTRTVVRGGGKRSKRLGA